MNKIARNLAEEIAKEFIQKVNPEMWDGRGKKPESVITKIVSFSIPNDPYRRLDISIELDDGEWCHFCEVVDDPSNDMLECEHGYGVDSYLNLADTIMDLV